MIKLYKCCVCNLEMNDKKPVRIVKQIYGAGNYNMYYPTEHYDVCYRCWHKIERFLKRGMRKDER